MNSRDVSTRHGASSAPASRPSEALEWLFSRDARYFSGTGTSLAGPASSRREVVPSPLAQSFRVVDRSAWRTCSSGKRHGDGDRRKGTARDSSAVLSPHWRRRWSGRDRRIYLAGPRARNRRAMHHLSRDPRSGRGLVRSPGRRCESRGLAVAGNWRGHDLNAVARAFFKSKRGDILETVPAVRLVVANRLKVRP
jgi:hypothetical protein